MHCTVLPVQESRVKYNQQHYLKVFNDPESIQQLQDSLAQPSLLALVDVRIDSHA